MELKNLTGIRKPTISQQLTILREEDLVITLLEGKQIFIMLSLRKRWLYCTCYTNIFCEKGKGEKK
jgi:DNA-binding transcriptional ArsR family regulator